MSEQHALTIKAYGKREVEIDVAADRDEAKEVMLSITAVNDYERDLYAFLTRDAAAQLRDWLNVFLDTGPTGE